MARYAHPESLATTEWLSDHLGDDDLRILDARFSAFGALPDEYQAGHIPGAVFVDLRADLADPSGVGVGPPDQLERAMRRLGISASTRVIAYDQSFGPWAAYVWWVLSLLGHDAVAVLDGGLAKWTAEGRPTEPGQCTVSSGTLTAHPRPELRATADDVLSAIGRDDTWIVDALPGKIFRGEVPMFPTHRAGHVPGAKNISAPSNIDRVHARLLPADELAKVWSRLALTPERKVITYCGAGPYGAFDLFALHLLGHDNAALYDRAWLEWGARPDLPVEVGPEREARGMHRAPSKEDTMATDNIALLKRANEEIWNKGNLDAADELTTNGLLFHDPFAGDLSSRDAFKANVKQMRSSFPDLNVTFDDIGTSGDKVYARWTLTGTNTGPLASGNTTNKRAVVPGMTICRIQDGKLAEMWLSYDLFGIYRQLGVLSAPETRTRIAPEAGAPVSVH